MSYLNRHIRKKIYILGKIVNSSILPPKKKNLKIFQITLNKD